MKVQDIINLMDSPSKDDTDLVLRAFNFAESAHKDQKRFSGEPYFTHVYETAKTLAKLGMSATTISAGLLHDSLEDGVALEDEIREIFGAEILFLVKGTTKLGKLKYRGVERHTESLRKLFVAISQDIRVIIIKLADRLHNMMTLEYVPEHKRKRIAAETLEIYVPIAYRLGIRKFNRKLEDLAFPYVYPNEYKKTKELSRARAKEDQQRLERFQRAVKKTLAKKGMTDFNVDYRLKTLYSLFRKLERKDWNIEKIYDISALRIIVNTVEDCYIVLGIIHGRWRPLPGRIKDYIAFPKPNGYQALHTTIFTGYGNVIEIQIKTKEMHREAEFGIASHINYKSKNHKDKTDNFLWIRRLLPFKPNFKENEQESIDFKDVPAWIKDLVDYQESEHGNIDKEELKTDFFQQRIFVFTPKGDVVDLPIDSTPIDFAYAIHSDIGNSVSGAKVNGKMTSLESPLLNGDIVEIMTKRSGLPRRKWLDYVKTASARKHIRAAIQKSD
ncbi:MAG: HD domain-containing protein [Minisyncoccales bacterium]|jgi:guanosine-3',5'-bis(diphosphate) 3'-pyrophosphohydrolase